MATILETIHLPSDLKGLQQSQLKKLAAEIRERLVNTVLLNGGHLASNLGVVELTIALHRVFNSPSDKIIWDVGHQAYTHKLLTGRKDAFDSIRQHRGLSGFTVRDESPHDAFGAGHAGTSISAALGMALARDATNGKNHIVAVIGDGALTTGIAFESVNHVGYLRTRLILVLNDNGFSIYPSIGALAKLLNLVRLDARYEIAKSKAKRLVTRLPLGNLVWGAAKRTKSRFRMALLPSAFWEELGFIYLGPIDGHDISEVEAALKRARGYETGPTIVHVLTKKGKGHPPAEKNAIEFHGVSPGGAQETGNQVSYSTVLGQTVQRLMRDDKRVVAITAAMPNGTGLNMAASEFPDRVFDVGICEQHAVTLATGLATQGFIPIVAIYSTFLQRAYDQVIHDVCTQNLPVVFVIDRAGIVSHDGKTHHGAFDLSYLLVIPNMVVAAPKDGDELQNLLFTAINSGRPFSIRYPKDNTGQVCSREKLERIPIGTAEVLRHGGDVAILAIGAMVTPALDAANILAERGIDCTVINARFAKPLDSEVILHVASSTRRLLTVEDNSLAGGVGSGVLQLVAHSGLDGVKVECCGLSDEFVEHGPRELLLAKFGLDANGITQRVTSLVGNTLVSIPTNR